MGYVMPITRAEQIHVITALILPLTAERFVGIVLKKKNNDHISIYINGIDLFMTNTHEIIIIC